MTDERRIHQYLARELGEAEAERFEEDLVADDELAAEVQRALEIRAALQNTAATPSSRPGRKPIFLFALAAAAGVAFVALTLPLLQRPATPVFRGGEQRMGLEIETDGGELRAHWAPVAGATGYELRVLARDGRVLESVRVDATEAAIDVADDAGAAAVFAEVVALDDLGQILRRSDRVTVTD